MDLRLRKTQLGKNRTYDYRNVVAPFSKCIPSKLKRNAVVFKFLRFEERSRKARFRNGLVLTVGITVEIKLRFKLLRCRV